MMLPCAAVLALLFLLSFTGMDAGLFLICLWAVTPLTVVLSAFAGGKRGLHPFACTLPGFLLLMLPLPAATACGLLCVVAGLVACVAGQEWQKQNNHTRSNRHGPK